MKIREVWLRAKMDTPKAVRGADAVAKALKAEGVRVVAKAGSRTDLALCISGDGTFLSSVRSLGEARYDIPVFGIHGSDGLGFLHSIALPPSFSAFESWAAKVARMIAARKYKLEERWGLEGTVSKEKRRYWALNDIVLNRGALSRMISVNLRIDGELLLEGMRGDGLIVSSSTGSTGYSLAAGGPVLSPGLDAMLVTPVCPHEMAQRPLVISHDAKIEVELIAPGSSYYLTADGQEGCKLSSGKTLTITRAPRPVMMLLPQDKALGASSYFERLRSKLGYGGD